MEFWQMPKMIRTFHSFLEKFILWPIRYANKIPILPEIRNLIAKINKGGEYCTNTFADVKALDHISTNATPRRADL